MKLTQAAGVVFCKHNAPVLHIRKLAHALTGMAKTGISAPPGTVGEGNRFHFLVLESFDKLGGDTTAFLNAYYHPFPYANFIMEGGRLAETMSCVSEIVRYFPRGKVYEIIHELQTDCDPARVGAIRDRGLSECPEKERENITSVIEKFVGPDLEKWFTVADLWEYLPNEFSPQKFSPKGGRS